MLDLLTVVHPVAELGGILERQSLWLSLLAIFVGGMALNLTPCVYPLIPVTLAFFSSQGSGLSVKTLWLALCYVVGISLSYAFLGVAAVKAGALVGSWLQQPVVLIGVAALGDQGQLVRGLSGLVIDLGPVRKYVRGDAHRVVAVGLARHAQRHRALGKVHENLHMTASVTGWPGVRGPFSCQRHWSRASQRSKTSRALGSRRRLIRMSKMPMCVPHQGLVGICPAIERCIS